MGIISRLLLNHPALGALGGAALYDSVEAVYEKIGDNMNSRFLTSDALASGNDVDLIHNLNVDFSDLSFLLYERNTSTNELIQKLTTGFTITATVGNEKTQVNVANASGVTRDIALIVVHGGGAGGGGGGALSWTEEAGSAPLSDTQSGFRYYAFEQGISQKLTAAIKVPDSYTPGTQITMTNYAYKEGTTNNYEMRTVATLVRSGTDAIDTVTNQQTSDTGDLSAGTAKLLTEFTTNLTDGSGNVNGVPVNGGDILRVEITRIAPAGTETTDDVKFIPDSTEVSFG